MQSERYVQWFLYGAAIFFGLFLILTLHRMDSDIDKLKNQTIWYCDSQHATEIFCKAK